MRTISNKVLLRLAAQANEADIYGDVKTADNLTKQIQKYAQAKVRAGDDDYEYSKEELVEDMEAIFWDAAVRVFDYYDETPDAKQIEEIVEFAVEDFMSSIEGLIHKNIGPHEPTTPGEEKPTGYEVSEKTFEIDEDDDYIEDDDDDDDDDEENDDEDDEE